MKTKFQNISILKISIFLFVILFSNFLTYAQIKPEKQKMLNQNFQYGVIVELKINEKLHFEDSLSISLTEFSHKRPYIGGPTKATAYLSLFKGDIHEEIMLSIHGIEGESKSSDGLSDSERYDSLVWMEYEFQLKNFDYDKSVKIIISKK